jgi:hypothetical protein
MATNNHPSHANHPTHISFSPSCHFSLAGTFNADEIDDLLGAMAGEHPPPPSSHHHDHHDGTSLTANTTRARTTGRTTSRTRTTRRKRDQHLEAGGEEPDEEDAEETGEGGGDEDDDEDVTTTPHEHHHKTMARSERKRSREKQRRCDVNRQFTDLTTVLKQIETEEAAEDHSTSSSTWGVLPRVAFSASNRVELIARTITHLERLNASNKRRKKEIDSLQQQLDLAKKAGEDTAAKLKEVMFNQPPPQTKQVRLSTTTRTNTVWQEHSI